MTLTRVLLEGEAAVWLPGRVLASGNDPLGRRRVVLPSSGRGPVRPPSPGEAAALVVGRPEWERGTSRAATQGAARSLGPAASRPCGDGAQPQPLGSRRAAGKPAPVPFPTANHPASTATRWKTSPKLTQAPLQVMETVNFYFLLFF